MNEKDIKSPLRESLFRQCKSPVKVEPNSKVKRCLSGHSGFHSSLEVKERKRSRRENQLAKDLLEVFPEVDKHFEITKKVGEGTFSKVYLAKFRSNPDKMIALKHLIPTSSPGRIENELLCLQAMGGKNNVLSVNTILRQHDHIVFVLPYLPHKKFSDFVRRMTTDNIRDYMRNLFIALRHVHAENIIHRDVKPSNFLYSEDLNQYSLIDFGLAMPVPGSKHSLLTDYTSSSSQRSQRLLDEAKSKSRNHNICKHPKKEICTYCKSRPRQSAPRAGTPGFRSPEVLMRYRHQTTAVDMWSAGVILLCILSGRYPFFKVKDDMEALAQLVTLFGSENMKKMAESIGKEFICSPPVVRVSKLKTLCENLSGGRMCSLHNEVPDDGEQHAKHKRKQKVDDNKENISTDKNSQQVDAVLIDSEEKCERSIFSEEYLKHPTETCNCLPDSVYDLLEKLLDLCPHTRMTAEAALTHPFIYPT